MRFKTDENLHQEIADALRSQGHDALTVWDQNMRGRPDRDLAAVCKEERRALISLDLDFADVRTYPPSDYHGLIVIRSRLPSRRNVLESVRRILPMLDKEPLSGRLWIVDQLGARIRIHDE